MTHFFCVFFRQSYQLPILNLGNNLYYEYHSNGIRSRALSRIPRLLVWAFQVVWKFRKNRFPFWESNTGHHDPATTTVQTVGPPTSVRCVQGTCKEIVLRLLENKYYI